MSVQVGVLLPSRDVVALGRGPDAILDLAVDAERHGYDSVWLGESVVARPRYDVIATLGALAVRTERVVLGTAVVVAPLRHPVLLAHAAATIDQLSGGRLILGVGAGPSYGPSRKEYASLGVPFDRRFARLREAIEVCRLLWQDGPVTLEGQFFQLRNVELGPPPYQAGGPPVWLGAKGASGRRLAGADFDGWLPGPESPEWFTAGLAEVRDQAASSGRDAAAITGAVYVTVSICADDAAGLRAAREAIERYYRQPYEVVANLHDSFLGPAEDAARWLSRYVAAGAEHLVVRLLGADQPGQLRELAPFLADVKNARHPAEAVAG